MKRICYWLMLSGIGLLVSGAVTGLAQEASEIPHTTIEMSADGFNGPEEMPEGAVLITFENNMEMPAVPSIARLNEGVTIDEVSEALHPSAEVSLISDLGGTMIMPGITFDVTFYFVPGTYVVYNLFDREKFLSFTVVDGEGDGAVGPDADVEIGLVDFAYNAPISVPAGSRTIHLENQGTQFHMMLIFRLDDSLTVHKVHELLLQESDSEELPEGVEEVASWFPMSAGEQAWINLDLEAGTYLLFCSLPDLNGSGHLHAELGMRQFFIVTDSE